MMKRPTRLFQLVAFSRLTMMKTNGMRLSGGARRGMCGCASEGQGGGFGRGRGGRWKEQQVANAMAMNDDGACLENGFGRGGQGKGYRGGGRGHQGGRWHQEQVADDTTMMMDHDGRGLDTVFGRGDGQGSRWHQEQAFAGENATSMRNRRGQYHQGGRNSSDRATIQNLIDNREYIQRTVEKTTRGIKTHTWSQQKQVSDWIVEHVNAMKKRMEDGNRIRQRDPLFVAAFDHAYLIDDFVVEKQTNGVKVTQTSRDRCTVDILHSHSEVVSGFIEHGRYEVRRNHPVPSSCPAVTPGSCVQAGKG